MKKHTCKGINSFETERKRFLRHVIWETNAGPRASLFSHFLITSECGKTLGEVILTWEVRRAPMGHYQSKDMLLKICV